MDAKSIREISDDEVAHFREHGWVKIDRLISPELAGELLERAKGIMGADATNHVARPGIDSPKNPWQDRHNICEEDALFASVGMSEAMGANAQRLLRRDIPVLMYQNALAVKLGRGQQAEGLDHATEPTDFHQDGGGYPMDRCGVVSFWIALDHLTTDMGLVRYLDRSHQLGPLGNMNRGGQITTSLFDVYPELHEMTLTDPQELQPGDAASHAMFTMHNAPTNTSSRPRWAFIVRYIAADTVYTGAHTTSQATIRKIDRAGLVPGEVFGGPEYPLVRGTAGLLAPAKEH
jgi:Phytanoyl-CoA dioxygenase (PhyH)